MPEQFSLEWSSVGLVAGVDEAGRGPLAGPVVAAAVILDDLNPIAGLADSKALTAAKRERLFDEIREYSDSLEYIVDDQEWPFPKYRDLLNGCR